MYLRNLNLSSHGQHGINFPNSVSQVVNNVFEVAIFQDNLLDKFVVFVKGGAVVFTPFLFYFSPAWVGVVLDFFLYWYKVVVVFTIVFSCIGMIFNY